MFRVSRSQTVGSTVSVRAARSGWTCGMAWNV
jgi:hypothetical protein